MKRVTLIITAVLTVLMLTACSSNKVVYESNTESQGGNKAWTVLIYMCGGDDESVNGDYSKKLDEIMNVNYSDNINVIVQTGGSSGTQRIYTAIIVRDLKPVRINFILRISLWRQIWVTTILLLILYRGARQSIKQTIICLFYQVQAAD